VIDRDGAQEAKRQARQKARQGETAAAPAPGSLDALRERAAEIEARLPDLRRLHQQRGDALAGRLLVVLERERAMILAKVGGGG
jgi:hypothetical protein